MEYCRGGSLQDKVCVLSCLGGGALPNAHPTVLQYVTAEGLPAYTTAQVAIIVGRIVSAVAYLHDNGSKRNHCVLALAAPSSSFSSSSFLTHAVAGVSQTLRTGT